MFNSPIGDQPVKEVSQDSLAPYNPTCDQAVKIAIDLLHLRQDDVLFDLGCGDGRLLLKAVRDFEGLRCIGIEFDPRFTQRAIESARTLPLECRRRILIRQEPVLQALNSPYERNEVLSQISMGDACCDLTFLKDATKLYLYLLPKGLEALKPILNDVVRCRLDAGQSFTVVTYMFQIKDWKPAKIDRQTKGDVPIYLYEFAK